MANGGSHTKKFLAKKAKPGETLVAALEGYKGKMMGKGEEAMHNGALILTDQRVAFYRAGLFGEIFETIPLDKLSSVETKTLLGHKTLFLHTSDDAIEFRSFEKGAAYQAFVDELEQRRHGSKPNSTQPAASSAIDKIRQLSELKAAGVLTDAEFETKKADLLSQV
ncbi:SHOCT domain-containing protein [Dongia soli]|uniref:SHOCT domain-containing protein n=1 Tax=Dongia soli TaxID=600628 RepID=A0ABU5E7I5_9PROT|nr:SHOCT domain-containing protein [Dongia soli]MDY0882282.1 SHOCT domain-containing protein [Dongia soli]